MVLLDYHAEALTRSNCNSKAVGVQGVVDSRRRGARV